MKSIDTHISGFQSVDATAFRYENCDGCKFVCCRRGPCSVSEYICKLHKRVLIPLNTHVDESRLKFMKCSEFEARDQGIERVDYYSVTQGM